jgi:sulfonate transport system substrate-binding protein
MKKLLSGFLVVSLLVGVLGIESLFAQEKKPKVIRIGASGGGYGKPFPSNNIGIIQGKGFWEEEFKQDGIKIEWNIFKGAGPAINESFANNNIDIAGFGDFPAIVGKAGGLKTKLIAGHYVRNNAYIAVPYDSPIASVKELKGKKVGLSKGTLTQLTLNRILDANGLIEKDLKLYNLGGADGEAALAAKEIDAYVGGFSLIKLRTLGIAKIIYTTKEEDFPDKLKGAGQLLVTEEFANKYPDIVRRIVKIWVKAAAWAAEEKNREEVLALWARTGTPLSTYKEEYEGLPIKLVIVPLLDEFYINHYKEGVAFAKERGLIRNAFDVDKWIDKSYLEAALKELGLENFWSEYDAEGKEKERR